MKRIVMSAVALASMFAAHDAVAVIWNIDNPSYSSWADGASWPGGVVPDSESNAEFAWENNVPGGPYYVCLNSSPVIAQLGQPSWRKVPQPTYIGTQTDRIMGRSITLHGLYRNGNTGAHLYVNVPVILSGDCLANIDKGYNAQEGFHLACPVSGPFGFTKAGTGSLWMHARNTYTGTTTISGGTLYLGDGTDPSQGSGVEGDIVNNGALELDPARGDTLVVHNLTGSGSLRKKGLGTVVFAGTESQGEGSSLTFEQHVWNNYGLGPIDCTVPNGVLNFDAYNVNYGFDFLGSENLTWGTGAVTLGDNYTIGVLKNTLTIEGEVKGNKKFTKGGRGTIVLKSASSYTGGTEVSAGILKLADAATLGTGAVTVGADSSLVLESAAAAVDRVPDVSALSLGGSLVQNAAATETLGALTLKAGSVVIKVADVQATSGFTFSSLASREAGNTTVFDLAGDSTVSFTTAMEGAVCAGALLKRGTVVSFAAMDADGKVVPLVADGAANVKIDLSGDMSLSAATCDTLELCNNSGAAVTVTMDGALVTEKGLLLSGSSPITVTGGSIAGNSGNEAIVLVANAGGVTLETPVSANNISFGGIGDLAIKGNLTAAANANGYINVNVDGNITWAQKNASCGAARFFNGHTKLAAGAKLCEANSNNSGNRSYLRIARNAVLDLNGVAVKSNSLSGYGELTNGTATSATLTCDYRPGSNNWGDFPQSFAGNLTGNVSLTVTGGDYYASKYVQTLSGENTTTGNIVLGGSGTLYLSGRAVLSKGAFYVNSAKVDSTGLAVGGCSGYYFKSFTYNGNASLDLTSAPTHLNASAVTLTVGGNTLALKDVAEETVGSSLTKAGAGTLRLEGSGTYTGMTTVSAGTLEISGAPANRTFTVASGATLKLSGEGEFHRRTALTVEEGGKISLLEKGKHIVGSFTLAGEVMPINATYGAKGSGATVQLDCFEGPGVLAFGTGFVLTIR